MRLVAFSDKLEWRMGNRHLTVVKQYGIISVG